MPKAKPYPDKDDDERTTIESQWEDEASTTVEQGEVADKVQRALNKQNGHAQHNTNHTHTGTGVDEPTVDDQHAPVLSAITPIRPDNVARLLIEQGNDAGQEIEIRPGKTYTVGRALDNDIVLTDIAVSRKHFDLKFDDGAWIIVDRGSGNGTVVNGNVEDNPFMLASGDQIEIGNTVFKYDQPNGAPRPSQHTYDLPDDEEMSTVAGKPLRNDDPPPPPPPQRPLRPKTVPPPMPMRSTHASAPPPLSYQQPPQPASTLPMPQMANRPPLMNPSAPTMLGDSRGMPMSLQNMPLSPTTIPGQGPQQRPSYPYPQASEIPPHSVHAQMLLIQTQNRRGDGSTAHVPPAPYDPNHYGLAPQRAYTPPQLSRRTKLAIAGIGLALLTGIVTAAVVKSSTSKPKAAASSKQSSKATKPDPKAISKTQPSKPTVEPINLPPAPKTEPVQAKGTEPKQEAKVEAKVEPKTETKVDPKTEAKTEAKTETKTETKTEAKTEAKAEAKVEAKVAPKTEAKTETKTETKTEAKVDPKQAKTEAKAETKTEAKTEAKVDPKQTKTEAKVDPKQTKTEAKVAKTESKRVEKKVEPDRKRESRREPTPKRVAAATDSSGARDKADGLYRDRKFNDAANVLASAAKSADDDEADELRDRSTKYSLLGKALAQGTAPAQKPTLAFNALTQALNLDANLGGNFKSDINSKLLSIAPKAAIAFFAQKDYGKARSAMLKAQDLGSTDSTLGIVKQKLEGVANDLYTAASAEASTNPGPAKEKLKQIRQLVEPTSKIAVKAQALYNKL